MILDRMKIQKEQFDRLKALGMKGHVVLAAKYYSALDFFVFSRRLKQNGISHKLMNIRALLKDNLPQDTILKAFEEGNWIYMGLYDNKLMGKAYIQGMVPPLDALLEIQKKIEKPVFIFPISVVYRNTLEKEDPSFFDIIFGYGDNPGFVRKVLIFLKYNKNCVLNISEPINLAHFIKSDSVYQIKGIANIIIESIDNEKRVCIGPIVKPRQEIKQKVLNDKKVMEIIEQFAKDGPKSLVKAKKDASKYFDEIAADYSPFYAELFRKFLTWLWVRIFERIYMNPSELDAVKEAAKKATIIYVPSHRSHLDYLVLNYMLYVNMLHSPRIAAGVNLLFWPMGTFFRKAGAFFIRRAFKGAKLYTAVFTSYLKMLIQEGYPIEFFLEGGRSRTGKLVNPKSGFITLILQAYLEDNTKNIAFVPISITYDKVPEDEGYIQELKGKEKEKESTLQLIKALKFLNKRYGNVYIRFSKPILVSEFMKDKSDQDISVIAQYLTNIIATEINRITTVTPLSVISAAILSKFKKGFKLNDLIEAIKVYLSYIKFKEIGISNLLTDVNKAVDHSITLLKQWRIVVNKGDKTGEFYGILEEYHMILEYYKNAFLHHILPCSLTCLSLITKTNETFHKSHIVEMVKPDILFLKSILQNEFVLYEGDEEDWIWETLQFLQDNNYIIFSPEGAIRLTQEWKKIVPLFTRPILGILENYWLVSKEAIRLFEEKGRVSRITPKNVSKLIEEYMRLNLIDYPEAINQFTINNAVLLFNNMGKSKQNVISGIPENGNIYNLSKGIERFLRSSPSIDS